MQWRTTSALVLVLAPAVAQAEGTPDDATRALVDAAEAEEAPERLAAPPRPAASVRRVTGATAYGLELDEGDDRMRALRVGRDSLRVGGYFQPSFEYSADTDYNEDDFDGFAFRNARFTSTGDFNVYRDLDAGARVELDFAEGGLSVLDLSVSFSWRGGLFAIDAGQFKTPFSLLELTSESTAQFPLARSGEVSIRRLLLGRDRGLQARSGMRIGDQFLELRAGVFNGQGANALKNFNSEFLYAGRAEYHPVGLVTDGEADLENSDFGIAAGFSATWTPSNGNNIFGLDSVGAEQLRLGGDVRVKVRGLSLRGEFLNAVTRREGEDGGDFRSYAMYVQAGYVLPFDMWPRFEVVGRWSRIDLDDTQDGYQILGANPSTGEPGDYRIFADFDRTLHQRWEFGLNAYLLDHRAKIGVLYRMTDLLEGARTDVNGDPLFGDTIFLMMQVGWL
jgi:hypothetical protein